MAKCLLCGESGFRFNFDIARELHLIEVHNYLKTTSVVKEQAKLTEKLIQEAFV